MQNYSKKKTELCLQKKIHNIVSEELHVGTTMEEINNPKYNSRLHKSLKLKFGHKSNGCEIKITDFALISTHGKTTKRFQDD